MMPSDPHVCMKCGEQYGGGCIEFAGCPYCACEQYDGGHEWRKPFDDVHYYSCEKCGKIRTTEEE